jgi:hypothetical protein
VSSISFGQAVSQRLYSWSAWKTLFLSRASVSPQYADDDDKYSVYFYDGPEVHVCEIWRGAVPYSSEGLQVQNDLDLTEFEASYKPLCNNPNISRVEISSVTSTTSMPSKDSVNPTFYVVFDRVQPGENKYVATLWNGSSTQKLVVQRIRVYNWQVTSVTGVLLEQQLEFITARTAGTSIPIRTCDTTDTVPVGVSADTNSMSVTTGHVVERIFATNDEMALTTNNIATWRVELAGAIIYDRKPGTKGHTLRTGQGLSVKNLTKSAVGSVSYIFEFTSEAL